jgi:hypothetical protein
MEKFPIGNVPGLSQKNDAHCCVESDWVHSGDGPWEWMKIQLAALCEQSADAVIWIVV